MEIIILAMEQNTTSGIKLTSTVVTLVQTLFAIIIAFLTWGTFLVMEAAASPRTTARKISCSMSDFWNGVIMLFGMIFIIVSSMEVSMVFPASVIALAESVTDFARAGSPMGKRV